MREISSGTKVENVSVKYALHYYFGYETNLRRQMKKKFGANKKRRREYLICVFFGYKVLYFCM